MRLKIAREIVAELVGLVSSVKDPEAFGKASAYVVKMLHAGGIINYYREQIEWSAATFGRGKRTKGLLDHIRKELLEIEAKPDDLEEWIDVVVLAMDGYWRHGGTADSFMEDLLKKQEKNFARKWPTPTSEDVAVEHDRSKE